MWARITKYRIQTPSQKLDNRYQYMPSTFDTTCALKSSESCVDSPEQCEGTVTGLFLVVAVNIVIEDGIVDRPHDKRATELVLFVVSARRN